MVVYSKRVLEGSPRIRGRKVSIGHLVSRLAQAENLDSFIQDYVLTREEILQALEYCVHQQCLADQPPNYCHNCSLRRKEQTWNPDDFEEIDLDGQKCVKGKNIIYMGTMEEFWEYWQGQDCWDTAVDLLAEFGQSLSRETDT